MKKLGFIVLALALQACAPEKQKDEMIGEPAPPRLVPTSPKDNPSEAAIVIQNDPTQGSVAQAVGFYSNGQLKNADALPLSGVGFVKIFRPRQRRYATYDLVYVLSWAARKLQEIYPSRDRLMIGDMSAMEGGAIGLHASHQNGLDADVAFLRRNQTEQNPEATTGFQEKFVSPAGKVTANFDMERNWAYAKILIESGRVQRMFVDQALKTAFCSHARATGELENAKETLRRIRPYESHEDHFHVRLTCPKNSPDCMAQTEVPPGPGC